jgi:hypothetical protein
MTILACLYDHGALIEEKPFRDLDDDKALTWAEEKLSDIFADGLHVEIFHKGRTVWASNRQV